MRFVCVRESGHGVCCGFDAAFIFTYRIGFDIASIRERDLTVKCKIYMFSRESNNLHKISALLTHVKDITPLAI